MPGDDWQRFANLRALYLYMFTHPGTKLLFMGNEFAQTSEWNVDQSLDWHLMQYSPHQGIFNLIKGLNHLYRTEGALFEKSFKPDGFQWVASAEAENSILVYLRKGNHLDDDLIIVLNLTPLIYHDYRIGIPSAGSWEVLFNSDDAAFGGSGVLQPVIETESQLWMNLPFSATISIPPLGGLVFKRIVSKILRHEGVSH